MGHKLIGTDRVFTENYQNKSHVCSSCELQNNYTVNLDKIR